MTNLVPEEKELADALKLIADKYGKFNDDNTGIWAGYTPASENEENAAIGVKCGNCVFFNSPNGCSIIDSEVEDGGLCRFAVLPDGAVNASGGVGAPAEVLYQIRKKPKAVTADADYGDSCPPATQDIVLNIDNRQKAIDNVGYGPLNPDEANTDFWQDKADRWNIESSEARGSVCGNCVFFDRRPKTLDCIETGLSDGGSGEQSAWDSIEQAELGYCTALDFKCAASRTCNAWAAGGPITEDVEKEETVTAASQGPCWDGYVQVGMKEKNGKMVPNCVPADEAALYATAGSKPAPKKDQIKGSDKNKKGSAATGKGVTFTAAITKSLEKKVADHNEKAPNGRKVTLAKLRAVYRRGAGAFSTSHRPDQNRNSWAMARVNAFLHLVKTGKPKNSKYTTDNDLLPKMHPRSSEASIMSPLLASLTVGLNFEYDLDEAEDLLEPWLE
jgi:hypothetical protein